jgi:hypothetical protein
LPDTAAATTNGHTEPAHLTREYRLIGPPLPIPGTKQFDDLIRSILVIIPNGGVVCSEMINTIWHWGSIGLSVAGVLDEQKGFVEITRGKCEREFLKWSDANPDCKYLVFVDSDEHVPVDSPLKLALWGLPIVSGVICGYSGERGVFACFEDYDTNGVPRFPTYTMTKTLPSRGLKRVHIAGTGLMCIRRDVFETILDKGGLPFMIPSELRNDSYRQGAILQGEDASFCAKAAALGFGTYVDFAVRGAHYKPLRIGWPESGLDDDLHPDDWHPTAMDYKGPR